MKKLTSILSAILLITSVVSSNVYADETENPDLYAIASSLGADTDHFNFINYKATEISDEIWCEYRKKISPLESYIYIEKNAYQVGLGGECNGISIIEMLVHNGIISASDIQEGAEHLIDITFDDSVNDVLTYYQMTQIYLKQYLNCKYYYCNHTVEETLNDLIKYGEEAMEDNKYFYIAFTWNGGGHGIVGIGESDGEWEFKGRKYNKCILTLDSTFDHFTPDACIYLNTEDNTFYFPAYDYSEKEADIINVTDSDKILNYKGFINPSYDSDDKNLTALKIYNLQDKDFELFIENGENTSTYAGKGNEQLDLTENYFYEWVDSVKEYVFESEKDSVYKIKVYEDEGHEYGPFERSYFDYSYTNENEYKFCGVYGFEDDAELEIAPHYISRYSPNYSSYSFRLVSDDCLYKTKKFGSFEVLGHNTGTMRLEEREDGLLLDSDSSFDAKIIFGGLTQNEDGTMDHHYNSDEKNIIMTTVISENDIMLRYDEEDEIIRIYIDKDGDNLFDDELQKGDVNSDGIIDATDASLILSEYADSSVNSRPFLNINENLADFNNDGVVDAIDASAVLTEYAMSSVS